MVDKKDHGRDYLKLQIYRKKLRLAITGLVVWLSFSIAITFIFRLPVHVPLLVFTLLSCFPTVSLSGSPSTPFTEPTEWTIPILLPYYIWRIKRIEKRIEKT